MGVVGAIAKEKEHRQHGDWKTVRFGRPKISRGVLNTEDDDGATRPFRSSSYEINTIQK